MSKNIICPKCRGGSLHKCPHCTEGQVEDCYGRCAPACPECHGSRYIAASRESLIDDSARNCPKCGGAGTLPVTCRRCGGRGVVLRPKAVSAQIS